MIFSSIKMKVTCAVFALVMLSMSAAALMVNFHNEKTLKKTIFSEQNTLLTAAARHIDDYLFEALVYLDDMADLVTTDMIASPARAQRFLDSRKPQQVFYDNTLVLFDRSGTVVAASPAELNPIGRNFAFRDYFQETVRSGKIVISKPIWSAQKKSQVIIMFTSPVFDAKGRVAGVLGGAVTVQKQRYLQSLRSHKLGGSGYLSLYDSSGQTIMHPVSRLLLSASPPDSMVGRGLREYQGTGETVAEDGTPVIRSVRRLQATDWILAVTYPVAEAYAPLYAARKYFLLAGVLASLLSALSVWHLGRALLAPLSAFTRQLKIPTADGIPVPVEIFSHDEVGVMAEAYNGMIAEMERSAERIAQLSRVIEQCPYTVVMASLDGTIGYANPLIAERGLSVEEVIGRNLQTLIPAPSSGAGAALQQAIARGAEWQGEIVRKGNGGEESWEYVSLSRLTSRSGEATHLVAIFKDITSRKEAEQALRLSEALHRRIFEENPQPMWVYDRETLAFLAVNNAAVRHYGYSSAEFLAMTIADIRPPADVPSLFAELSEERGGFRDAGIWQHVRKDGDVIHVSVTSHPLQFFGRSAEIVLIHDVTAKKKVEDELRLSEERYRAIFDGVADVIFSMAPDGSFVSLNGAFEKILGWPRAEWIGRSFNALIHEEDKAHVEAAFLSCVAGKAVRKLEYRARTADGDFVYLEVDATPRFGDGEVIQVQGIARDITQRMQLEQQLRQSQKMEALGTLTAGIAHDFNNILTAIAAYASLLQRTIPAGEVKCSQYLGKLVESAGRAGALTRSLLAYSRNQPLNKQVVDLNQVLRDIDHLLSPLIGEQIEFRTMTGDGAMTVMADPHQIEQVLINLATNARDAMPDGGLLTIEVEAVTTGCGTHRAPGYIPEGSYVRLAVSDTGSGIDQKTRERIFEPFFTTKDVNKGTGLGLAIVYGIVKQHDGYIDICSDPEQGTCFSIYLPAAARTPAPAEGGERMQEQGDEVTVLLVEDDAQIRAPLKELLQKAGYGVIEAADGEEAVAQFRQHQDELHLVIMDVVMPRKNGGTAYGEIRKIKPGVKVLFTSGYASDVLNTKGFCGEDMSFISKPIAIETLLSKIKEVMQRGH